MLTQTQTSHQVVDFLTQAKLVAIIRLPDLTHAVELARALIDGGIKALEFTLNSPGAIDAIAKVRATLPEVQNGEVIVGAGTVLTVDEARASIDAGAQFCISPSVKLPVIDYCKREGVAVIPGAFTPTEIETAWEAGADIVKVFPSRAVGPKYIKELRGPFPHIRLMPTGGVEREMIRDFLLAGAVAVGVGGVASAQIVASGDWAAVTNTAREYVSETQPGA